MTPEEINHRIAEFKGDVAALSDGDIVQKHIVFGDCAAISPSEYFALRKCIAGEFGTHPNDILVVGSGKLGFSIAPHKRYRHFADWSDLDVVIISDRLFDAFWEDVHRFTQSGGYHEDSHAFQEYHFNGWMRPDKLPSDHVFPRGKRWWEFFNDISASRDYSVPRIRGAIYKNFYFLESYQTRAVKDCAAAL